MSDALRALLHDERSQHGASYRGTLSNHLPMCLTALHRLGAPPERLASFAAAYQSRLEPAEPWPRARAYEHEVSERGADVVLRAHLGRLLPGLAGAAFHGVIRVAYGVIAGDDGEIAAALAYLEDNPLIVDASPTRGRTTELADLAARLREAGIGKPAGPTITERLLAVAEDERFQRIVKDVAVDRSTLGQVSGLGARWYLAADDFASLHVLTAAHALRRLRPFVVDEAAADRALAVGALAAYVVCGSPARSEARGLPVADDAELKARAIAADDDHVAKLVVAALDEEAAMEDRIYRIVATRAARRAKA